MTIIIPPTIVWFSSLLGTLFDLSVNSVQNLIHQITIRWTIPIAYSIVQTTYQPTHPDQDNSLLDSLTQYKVT